MNLDIQIKNKIFKILESSKKPFKDQLSKTELSTINKVFCFGRCEFLLKSSQLIDKLSKKDQKKVSEIIKARNANSLNIFNDFLILAKELKRKKIDFIPVKGIHLQMLVYRDINLRPIRDIDLLIKEKDLDDYLTCMFSMGYRFKNLNIELSEFYKSDYHYDIPVLVNSSGTHIETHLRIINKTFNDFIHEKKVSNKIFR